MQIVGWDTSVDGLGTRGMLEPTWVHPTARQQGPTAHQFCCCRFRCLRERKVCLSSCPSPPRRFRARAVREAGQGNQGKRKVEEAWSFPWNYGAVNGTELPREEGGRRELNRVNEIATRELWHARLLAWNVQIVPRVFTADVLRLIFELLSSASAVPSNWNLIS